MPTMRPQPWHAYQLGWESDGVTSTTMKNRTQARRHGTPSCYSGGCRCADCRRASAKARARYRAKASA